MSRSRAVFRTRAPNTANREWSATHAGRVPHPHHTLSSAAAMPDVSYGTGGLGADNLIQRTNTRKDQVEESTFGVGLAQREQVLQLREHRTAITRKTSVNCQEVLRLTFRSMTLRQRNKNGVGGYSKDDVGAGHAPWQCRGDARAL